MIYDLNKFAFMIEQNYNLIYTLLIYASLVYYHYDAFSNNRRKNTMQVVFCSTNPAKTAAALLVLKKRFKDCINLLFLQTESGVNPTPFGVDECIRGANNRIVQGM